MSQRRDRQRVFEAVGLRSSSEPRGIATHHRVVTLAGPPGIGKSHLLRDVIDALPADRTIVRVFGDQLDQHIPLGGIHQILDHPIVAAGARLPPPDTAGRHDNIELTAAGQVLTFLDHLADIDGMLIVDDAHWLDETSRRVLAFAIRRLDDRAPITVVAERRGNALIPTSRRIDLSGLSDDEVQMLLEQRLGEPIDVTVRDDCLVATSGNPLAVIEWGARDHESGGHQPVEIGRSVLAHDLGTRQALCLVARSRRGDDVEAAWQRVVDASHSPVDMTSLAHVVREGAGDVVEPDAPLRFRHPEHRTAATTCVDVHDISRIAAALADTTSDDDSAAWHLADATPTVDDDVARLLGSAAQRSLERGTPIEAARASERAAELANDPALAADQLIAASEAWWYACFPAEAARVSALGVELPVGLARRVRLRQLHRAAVGWQHDVLDTIRGNLDDAHLVESTEVNLATALRAASFIEACLAGQIDLAAEVSASLSATVDGLPPAGASTASWSGVASICRMFVDVLRSRPQDDPEVAATDDSYLSIAARSTDRDVLSAFASIDPAKLDTGALNLLQLVGFSDLVLGHHDDAEQHLVRLRTESHARGAVAITDFTDATLAELERRTGRWASALSRTMTDLAIDPTRTSAGKAWQRAIRARIVACQGGSDVDVLVDSVLDEAEPVGMTFIVSAARAARASALLIDGSPEDALDELALIEQAMEHGGASEFGVLWIELDQIEALWKLDRHEDIRRLARKLEDHHARTGRPWSLAMAMLGRVLTDERPPDEATRAAAALGAPFDQHRVELLLVEHAARSGRSDADTDIDRLRARFARFGAKPFVDRCERLASSSTGPQASGIHDVLSPAELRVAVTVAAGRTNAEAAGELYLSIRTVEAHLRSIFRKLGVRNRVEVATAVNASARIS